MYFFKSFATFPNSSNFSYAFSRCSLLRVGGEESSFMPFYFSHCTLDSFPLFFPSLFHVDGDDPSFMLSYSSHCTWYSFPRLLSFFASFWWGGAFINTNLLLSLYIRLFPPLIPFHVSYWSGGVFNFTIIFLSLHNN